MSFMRSSFNIFCHKRSYPSWLHKKLPVSSSCYHIRYSSNHSYLTPVTCSPLYLNKVNYSKSAAVGDPESDTVTDGNRKASSLYVPRNQRTQICSILEPYFDFDGIFHDIDSLFNELKSRPQNSQFSKEKLVFLKEYWSKWKVLLKERENLEKSVKKIQNNVRKLSSEEGDKKHAMHQQMLVLKQLLKQKSITEYEEVLVPGLLELPNRLHASTPRDEDTLITSFSAAPTFSFEPLTHVQLGNCNNNIEFSDASPGAFYLTNDLAELELSIEDYFVDFFHECNYIHHSNPDLGKGVLVEGCGFDIQNRREVLKILHQREANDSNLLYLTGGCSLPAFVSYFCKRIIGKPHKYLPQKLFATGRLYQPLSCLKTAENSLLEERSYGIFSSMQSSAVSAFVAFSPEATAEQSVLDELLSHLVTLYQGLGVHFRIVQKCAASLEQKESAAFSIEMYSTLPNRGMHPVISGDNYVEIGRISLLGDYVSKRLLMLHTSLSKPDESSSSPSLNFVNVIYVKVIDISKFIAVLLENNQKIDRNYYVPSVLNDFRLK